MKTLRAQTGSARYYAYEDWERRHVLVHHENCPYVRKRLARWDDEWRDCWHDLGLFESPEHAIADTQRVVRPTGAADIRLCGHCARRLVEESHELT